MQSTFRRLGLAGLIMVLVTAPSGCGGGDPQDENEPEGTWKLDVLSASFPGRQRLADQTELRIKVKNVDSRAVPNLAITVDGFDIRKEMPELADPKRPIWVIDDPPANASAAFTNTWAIGKVPAGQTRTFVWKVTSVRAGTYTLRFRVAAGLHGNAKARLPDGSIPRGSFIARISEETRPVDLN